MTTVNPDVSTQTSTDQSSITDGNEGLVEYKNRLEAENKEYRTALTGFVLEKIGLDPSKGLGKAIAKEYRGDFTVEAVAAYARDEYDYETEIASTVAEPEIEAQQQAADQITAASVPVIPESEQDRIAGHDEKLATPDASREDAKASIVDKFSVFQRNLPPV